jgi:hypothetical protein
VERGGSNPIAIVWVRPALALPSLATGMCSAKARFHLDLRVPGLKSLSRKATDWRIDTRLDCNRKFRLATTWEGRATALIEAQVLGARPRCRLASSLTI